MVMKVRPDGTFTPRVISTVSGATLKTGTQNTPKQRKRGVESKSYTHSVDAKKRKLIREAEEPDPGPATPVLTVLPPAFMEEFTMDQQRFFLALAKYGTPSVAALKCGISHKTLMAWRQTPAFAKSLEEFDEVLADLIDSEVFTRAMGNGSDAILMFAAKGAKPDKYRDNSSGVQVGIVFQMPEGIMGEADASAPGFITKSKS